MLFLENIKLALSSIRVNRMRSFLTMLGIIIGISSVIAITSIGDSAKSTINAEFSGMSSYMYLYLNWENDDGTLDYYPYFFTEDDVTAVKERFSDDIRYAVPSTSAQVKVTIGNNTGQVRFSGVGKDIFKYNTRATLLKGRDVEEKDIKSQNDVVYLSKETAMFFYRTDDVIGKVFPATVNGENRDFTVVGLYENKASIFSSLGNRGVYDVAVPYQLLMDSDGTFGTIEILGNEEKNQEAQGKAFATYLEKIKQAPEGLYKFETVQSQLSMANNVLSVLSVAIGAIAGIALIVGGIGIMNIMLVSVTERTREIGIRKSLGARTNDILTQFILEAMILSVIGGIIGTALGISIAVIGMTVVKAKIAVNPVVVIGAVIFSAFVGILFGILPAKKAAELDPIEALRYE